MQPNFESVRTYIFDPKCGTCHAGPSGKGGVDLTNLEAIVQRGLIEWGNAEGCKLYKAVANNSMPPGGPPLSEAEKN